MQGLVFLSVLAVGFAAHAGFKDTGNVEWRQCVSGPDAWVTVKSFDITPSPIKVPGPLRVNLDSAITHPLKEAVTMNVVMEKELLGVFTKVVCVKDVGTCHYDDPCHFLNSFKGPDGCPKELQANGLPCTCPFDAQAIKLPNQLFTVTSISSAWSFLATGTYHVKVTMTDKASSKQVACFETYLKIQH